MKRGTGAPPWLPPKPPRYNVQLPSEQAYFQGQINLQGEPSVHIRIGDYSHVAKADSAIVLAKALLEQAEWAIKLADAWRAIIEDAKRADAEDEISKAERGGDSGEAAKPTNRVRECAEAAQAGDATAARSASPSNASLGEAAPFESRGDEATGALREELASADASTSTNGVAPVADELCDIDDLPDCLVGGVHQPHCRHAGKPVTKGGNP